MCDKTAVNASRAPNGPCWRLPHQRNSRSDSWLWIAPPGWVLYQTFPTPSLGPRWLYYEGPDAHPALFEVARRPLLGGRLDEFGLSSAQEQGHRPWSQKFRGVGTISLTLGTWQPSLPPHPPGKHQWASALVWTGWSRVTCLALPLAAAQNLRSRALENSQSLRCLTIVTRNK
jgi:hypothetical protein